MKKEKLEELKEDLKLAKEANDLTISTISKIVGEATTKIVQELKFDKEVAEEVAKDVLDTTTTSLKDFGLASAENIKASSNAIQNGIQKVLKDEIDFHSKKFEELQNSLNGNLKVDVTKTLNEFKAFGELSLNVLKSAAEGAIKGAKDALEEKKS